jgi:WD40 repeat protein
MADAGAGEKLKVFVSYSRRDSAEFADELVAGLAVALDFAPFLDRHDIAAGEDWEVRLGGLIADSDGVVFVVSPEAVKSERCLWEVNRTIELSKRLLPVVFKPVPEHDIPEKLGRLQFISFDSGLGFTRPLTQLAAALRVDLNWIREHTRLGEIATRWDGRGRPEWLLLRADDLKAAKAWMSSRNAEAPEITDMQRAFVMASEDAEAARVARERAQLRRTARLLWMVASLILLWFGYVLWKDYDVARREIDVFTARAEDALNDEQFDRAMRYALVVYPARGRLWAPNSNELEAKLIAGAFSTRLHRLLKGHSASVRSAYFSGDGKLVVTASDDKTARIWDAESGKEVVVLKGHGGSVNVAAFSADGKRVVTASTDGTARIWDAQSGKEIVVLIGHRGEVRTAAFRGDGKQVATASNDRTARVWDAESGEEIAVIKSHGAAVRTAAFSVDGKRVVAATADPLAIVWDVENGKEIAQMSHSILDDLFTAEFSGDGKWVVTASTDETARVWDAQTGKQISALQHDGPVRTAIFSPDGRSVVTASDDKTARIWNAESGRQSLILRGHDRAVKTAVYNGNGWWLVTASDDKTARIWRSSNGAEFAVLKGHEGAVNTAKFSGDRVVTASSDFTARIWNETTLVDRLPVKRSFSGDGKRMLKVSNEDFRAAEIWNTESGEKIAALKPPTSVNAAAFSDDGTRVVMACRDNTARIWDAESGKEIVVLKGHGGSVNVAAFSADGKRVVTASTDGTARIWDAQSGKEIAVLKGHRGEVRDVAFRGDGKRVVSAAEDGTARIWDAESGKEILVLKGSVNTALFSVNGERVVTVSSEHTRIWDAESGAEIAVIKGRSHDTVHIWDVTWATLSGDPLRERVCAEKLVGAAQEFSNSEMEDPILRGIDKDDPIARNPCLRRGPLSLDYWTRLPGQLWRSTVRLFDVN